MRGVMFPMKLRIKNSVFFIGIFFLSGCTGFFTQNPSIEDLEGNWESTSPVIYSKLIFSPNQENLLVVVGDEKVEDIFKLQSLEFSESGFEFEAVSLLKKSDPLKMKGQIILGRILLSPIDKDEEKIWYMKSTDLVKFQAIADNAVKKHNKSFQQDASKAGASE